MTDYNNIVLNQVTYYRTDDNHNILKDKYGKPQLYYSEQDDFLLNELLDQLTIDYLKEL